MWRQLFFHTMVRMRLRLPVAGGDIACPLCDGTADKFGDHARVCPCVGDCVSRHHELCNLLAARAKAAGLQPEIEKANLRPPRPELQGGVEDGGRRLADIWVPRWNLRGPVAFDLAVASGLRQGHLAASVADGSRATMDYEVRKCQVGACSGCRSLCQWLALSSIGRMPGRAFAT